MSRFKTCYVKNNSVAYDTLASVKFSVTWVSVRVNYPQRLSQVDILFSTHSHVATSLRIPPHFPFQQAYWGSSVKYVPWKETWVVNLWTYLNLKDDSFPFSHSIPMTYFMDDTFPFLSVRLSILTSQKVTILMRLITTINKNGFIKLEANNASSGVHDRPSNRPSLTPNLKVYSSIFSILHAKKTWWKFRFEFVANGFKSRAKTVS